MGELNELQTLNERNLTKVSEVKVVKPLTDKQKKSQWTPMLIFASLCSTMGTAVPTGYCVGVMNSPGVFIRQWCNEMFILNYDIHLSSEGLDLVFSGIISIFLIGGAVGSFLGAIVANKLGRKRSLLICGILYFLGGLCFYTCRLLYSFEVLICGRFLAGIASGITTTVLPMYHSEIAPLALRGTLGVFCVIGLNTGLVISQFISLSSVLGNYTQWHIALSLYVVIVCLCFTPYCLYPESPKWLAVVKADRNEAQLQLQRLRGAKVRMEDFTQEMDIMDEEAKVTENVRGFCDVLKDKKLLLPLVLVCAFQGGQQLAGINAIFYYSVSIFQKAGLSDKAAEWANVGSGCMNLVTSLFVPYLMAKVNRRPLMLTSSMFCGIFLLGFAILLQYIDYVSWFAMACIACIFFYITFFQFGIGPIPFFIGSELFEVSPRPVAMSLGSLASWSCNFAVGMTFPTIQNMWGSFSFLPFALSCFVVFFLTLFYLPETRGRNPSDVAAIVAGGFRSKVL
uniref:Major facilitator superfamily (MFS) profile domain-containing protein n=1 Tax=Stomoxys calcitrans TaxID=35570 RepID=A0A1I8NXF7_STOCA